MWNKDVAGCIDEIGFMRTQKKRSRFLAYREAWPRMHGDRWDGEGADGVCAFTILGSDVATSPAPAALKRSRLPRFVSDIFNPPNIRRWTVFYFRRRFRAIFPRDLWGIFFA